MNERSFEELLSEHLDGSLDESEQRRFVEMLRDPALAKQFVISRQLHAMLAWEHGVMPALHDTIASVPKRGWRRWLVGLVCAASLLLAASLFRSDLPVAKRVPEPVGWQERSQAGTLAKSYGGQLSVPELKLVLHDGDELRVGTYQLAAGFVQMDIGGVELTVESPARFQVASDERVVLETGRVTARVPRRKKKKFQLDASDLATVEIQPGSVTGVDADEEASEVHVFEGDAEVLPKNQEQPVRLKRSKATRISRAGRRTGVDVDAERFVCSFVEPVAEYTSIVQSLKPVVYFRMASEPDGVSLPNVAQQTSGEDSGRVYVERMKRPPFAAGQIGSSLRLTGPNSGAYAVYSKYPLASKSLTLCAWVKAHSRPRWASIAQHATRNEGQFHLGLHDDDGDLEIGVRDAAGNLVEVREHKEFPLRSWQFIAFVADGSTVRLFRDGNEIGSAPCQGLSTQGSPEMGIGVELDVDTKPSAETPGFWDGRIDELAIFHHAVSQDDIKRLYEASNTTASRLALCQDVSDQSVAATSDCDRSSFAQLNLQAR